MRLAIAYTCICDRWIISKLLFSTPPRLSARRYSDRNKCISNHRSDRHRRGRSAVSNRFAAVWLISLWHSRAKINLRPIDRSQIMFPFHTITWHHAAFIAAVMFSLTSRLNRVLFCYMRASIRLELFKIASTKVSQFNFVLNDLISYIN